MADKSGCPKKILGSDTRRKTWPKNQWQNG
jgi:hypothetical protein